MSITTLTTSAHALAVVRPVESERKSAFDARIKAMREHVLTVLGLSTVAAVAIAIKAYVWIPNLVH